MPSFGFPSSMPPGTSSLSPGRSTRMSSNVSSGPEPSSCAAVPDECMSHLFGSSHIPPPPPLSLSEAASYSPPPPYPPVFPFGPPLLASARFPPPPNPSCARPASNITFFEGPQSHYPPDNTAYDRWSDRCFNSIPYGGGGDHKPKSFAHWPLPTYNSYVSSVNNPSINMNSENNNSSAGFLKPEPIFQPFAPYPPVDSVTNFGPKFSPFSGFPNAAAAAGMPSTPSASITSPLASGHFGAFPPPNLPLDFPHSSGGGGRFPFNPHGPIFLPGMDPPPAFGPGNADFMPEPFPSYLSRPGAVYQPSSAFHTPDHFHDTSPRPIPSSAETTPRPVASDSIPVADPAFKPRFYYPHPETIHGCSNLLSHTFSSRSDNNPPGPLCSSEGPLGLEFSSDFLAPFTLPYPPPHPGSLFTPYSSSAPPLYQDSSSRNSGGSSFSPNKKDEERTDRIAGETGNLLYQHLSPEEWRWKHYEPAFATGLDPSGIFARVRPSGFNHFNGVDSIVYSTVANSSNGFVVKEEGSSSGALKSQKEQLDMLERSKAQNQPGPSLKLAASALAEMLASGSNGASSSTGRSMLSQIGATSGTALTSEGGFQLVDASSGGQVKPERMLEDCCSSSGSAVVFREGRDGSSSLPHGFGELTADGFVSGLNLGLPTRSKREIAHGSEDAFCDFGGAPASWALPNPPGHVENSANPLPMSWVDAVPQSAKGGAMHASGLRRVFSKGSAGIIRQRSVSTGSAKLHGAIAENSTSENSINLLTQSSNQSSRPQSGRMREGSSKPVVVPPSDDPASVIGPISSKVTANSLFGLHQEVSSGTGCQLPSDLSHNDQWQVKSTSCGSSPPLSQAHLDQQRSMSGPSMGAASRVLANLKWSCPESSSQTEVAYFGTGFHSLTASISNLSKVLFSLDSSALTPPESAVLEETLQSSILRLSECLLLEQARINRNPATRFVGSDESSTSRQGRADGSLTDLDFGRHTETGGSTNLAHLKASDLGVLQNPGRSGSPSHLCNLNDLRATGTTSALETVDLGGSVIDSHSVQRPFPVNNESYSVSQCSMNDVGFRVGKDSRGGYYTNPKRSSSFQQDAAVGDDIIQLLRENHILEPSSLERLIAAEEREAKLKILVEELREELEQERVENRGTAILCEKIMQEAEVSKGKAVMRGAQISDLKSENRNRKCNVQGGDRGLDNSTLGNGSKSEASIFNGESDLTRHEQGRQSELGEETDSNALLKNHEGYLYKIDQLESRLALLRAGPEFISGGSSGSKLGEDMDAVASGNRFEDADFINICKGESQRTLLPRPAVNAPRNISHDTSESVESRIALLQARETSMHEHSSHEANNDVEEVMTYPWVKQSTKHDTTSDGVEARLALLHGRPDWDNELGVFTETEPCTPAIPPAVDLDSSTGSLSGHSLSGLNDEERVAFPFAVKALNAMSRITSQLLVQSEAISNMHTAWSQLSEQVNPKSPEKESNTELQQKEVDVDVSNAAKQGYGGTEAVEARALLIRSRPDWIERGMSEREIQDFLGFNNISSTNSACARYESDQIDTMNQISTILLDFDALVPQPLQVKITTDCPSQPKENGDTGRVEPSELENGDPATTQDSEDDSSWEHVPCAIPSE